MAAAVELSVVIPCRNAGATLAEQLDALAGQEWDRPWEVVVVDNGSTDDTADVARRYHGRLDITIIQEPRPGLNVARNAGVRAARCDAVAICDGDDVVAGGWLAAMGDALRHSDYVTGPVELDRLNPPGLAKSRGYAEAGAAPSFYGAFPYARGCNLGVKRPVLAAVGGFDEETLGLDDQELGLRMSKAQVDLVFVPDAVVHYRYRRDLRGIWRQGRFYGDGRVAMYKVARAADVPLPHRAAGWRSWVWLVVHVVDLRSSDGRLGWVWVLANRWGHLRGSLRHRTVFV
jgi:glycosyltransferase involved in cell wall biosynthesis